MRNGIRPAQWPRAVPSAYTCAPYTLDCIVHAEHPEQQKNNNNRNKRRDRNRTKMLRWQSGNINNNSVEFVNVPGADARLRFSIERTIQARIRTKCWATPVSPYIQGSAQRAVWPRLLNRHPTATQIVTLPYYNNKNNIDCHRINTQRLGKRCARP